MNTLPGKTILLLAAYAITSSAAVLLLRKGLPQAVDAFRNREFAHGLSLYMTGGALLYAVSFVFWLLILARTYVTIAFPLALAIATTLTVSGAVAFLGEKLSPVRALGIVVILVGILLLGRKG